MIHVGEIGELVNVKPGFARNYLLPRGLAVQANDRQINAVEHEKRVIEARVARARAGAEKAAGEVRKVTLEIEKAAGENGKLFGSVTSMEIQALLAARGHEVDRRKIALPEQIKALGTYQVGVKLHRDVTAQITIIVKGAQAVSDSPPAG